MPHNDCPDKYDTSTRTYDVLSAESRGKPETNIPQ